MSYFDAKRFGIHTKAARGKRSLRKAAEEIGCSASTLSRIENGANDIDLYTFLAICEWFELSPSLYLVQSEAPAQSKPTQDALDRIEHILRNETWMAPDTIAAIMVMLRIAQRDAENDGGAQ